ncbi:MAG: hypothetical protein ACE5LQ_03645, partial [Candidatus Bipolaricaulia bacterium]
MRRRKFSLKYKFILTLVAFTFLLSISFGTISIKRLSSELHTQLIKDGQALAETLAEKFSNTADRSTFIQNLRFVRESRSGDVLYIQVVIGESQLIDRQPGLGEIPPLPSSLPAEGMAQRRLANGTE